MGVEVTLHQDGFEQVFEQFPRYTSPPTTRQELIRSGSATLRPMSEHASISRFRTELERLGGTGRIVVLPDSVHTAQLAADALGCEVGAIANSLLFTVPTERRVTGRARASRCCCSPAARTAWTPTRSSRPSASPRSKRAKPDFVRRHTGQVIGGVSPFDHPAPVRTYLDPWLRRYDEIWAAAGHPAAVFSTTFEELQRMTGAEELEVE